MLPRIFRVLAVSLAFSSVAPVAAQRGGRQDDVSPLGGFGVAGRSMTASEAAGFGIASGFGVWKVFEGGVGHRSGLKRGDILVALNGKASPAKGDSAMFFEAIIEKAEVGGKVVTCTVLDTSRKKRTVKVKVRKIGKIGATPAKCTKTKRVIGMALKYLAGSQSSDGSWHNATNLGGNDARVVMASLAGLCFVANGSTPQKGPYARTVQKALEYVLRTTNNKQAGGFGGMGGMGGGGGGGGNWNQVNWQLGYAPLFLAELYHHYPDPRIKAKVTEIVNTIIKNQEPSGGWAHGPGGPNALGYVELEIVSNWALSSIGMARSIGVKVPDPPLGKALDWIQATSPGDGGVGYSTRPGQRFGDPGRTAGAIFACTRLGAQSWGFYRQMVGYYRRTYKKLASGHVSPVMHILQGALASACMGSSEYKRWWDQYRPYIMVSRWPDGSLLSRPSEESLQMGRATDQDMGPNWSTTNLLLAMSLDMGKLKGLVGKPKKPKAGRKPSKKKKSGKAEITPGKSA